MDQMKRRPNESEPSDIKPKKLRTIYDEENLWNTCLENLSTEIFYEIFEYLDGCDIHKAFSNLNIRFRNLVIYATLPLKINLSFKAQSTLEHRCRDIIIPNKHRILSLHLNGPSIINDFFNYCNLDSSFNRLESIALNGVFDHKLLMILFYLNFLPRLSSLTIQLEEDSIYNVSDIYRVVFRLPSLKYNKLSAAGYDDPEISIPIPINQQFSTIEHLVIDICCSLTELTSVLHHVPHLRRFTCKRLVEMSEIDGKEVSLTLPNLTHMYIPNCEVEFNDFEVFLKKICSKLQVLHLKTSSDIDYLDANRWKQLIKKHMPHLYNFHFDHHMCIADGDDIIPDHKIINQFISPFWIDHQWFIELEDDTNGLIYSVHRYKKQWYDHHNYTQWMTNSDRNSVQQTFDNVFIRPIPFIQLTIEDYISNTWNSSYMDNMKPCFSAVQFTNLNIDCHAISISMLIEIIRLLPNLESLKVSFLSTDQLNTLSNEDAEMLLLVSITNKITKVKLNTLDGKNQVQFLMNICPRMQYLEVECTTANDMENIIGLVSTNNTHIHYLNCLCFCIYNADEKMIRNVDVIIGFESLFGLEKLFHDYGVQRVQNKIYLKWKL